MGFYGNITNVNNTTFVFDRIYPNRVAMDQNADIDGIFIGRYVLIEYDNDEKTFFNEVYIENERFYFSIDAAKKTEIKYQDTENENYYVTTGTVVYTEVDGKYTYYKCIGSKEDNIADFQQILDVDVTNSYFINYTVDKSVYPNLGRGYDSTVWQKTYVNSEEKYVMIAELNSVVPTFDLTVDAPTMNPSPPHFDADSTNVYYKMHVQPQWGFKVAHANPEKSVPSKDNEFASVAKSRPSDEQAIYKYHTYNKNQNYNEHYEMKYDAAIYYNKAGFNKETRSKVEINNDFKDAIMIEPTGYSGQKYNAHNSVNPNQKVYKKDIQELSIILPSLGNTINDIWDLVYGEWDYQRDENNEIVKDVYGKELTTFKDKRNLNIDWGNTSGLRLVKRAKDNNGFEFDPRQSQTIAGCINSVNDLMGMIITNNLIPEEESIQKENESDKDYKIRINNEIQKALNLAVTNRIYYGNYDINNPSYKGYYIKYPDDEFVLYEEEFDEDGNSNYTNLPEDFAPVTLTPFEKRTYYYIDNDNYYLEQTTKPSEGVNYYHKIDVENIFKTKILAGELDKDTGKNIFFTEYKPNTYYELDKNYNYIYTTEEKPIDSKIYYNIGEKELNAITSGGVEEGNLPTLNQSILFNPFNHYSDVQTDDPYDENVNWTGYFYKGVYNDILDDDLYFRVEKDSKFDDSLEYYFAKNYKIDRTYDIEGKPVIIYDFSDEKDKHGKLVPINFKNFIPPTISKDENDNIINIEGSQYYIKKENPETKLIEYELFVPSYNEVDGSYIIPSDIIYYEITPTPIATPEVPFYWPGLYYYKETWGDYIKAEESSPVHEEYFIIKKETDFNPVEDIFYKPGKFFYENESGYYILDYSENMDPEKDYYTAPFYYVKEDPTGMFPVGSIWNTSIKDLPRDEETGKSLVILATRVEGWKWKELVGFARDFNTIHGLIIEINKILKTGDAKTRDLATVQGCINSINDIIVKIGKLKPAQIAAIDKYGRIAGSDYTTVQDFNATRTKYNYETNQLDSSLIEEKQSKWIDLNVNLEQVTPVIEVQHIYNPINSIEIETNMNTVPGNEIQISRPVVDNTGHVIAVDSEKVQLPNGFKTIQTDESETAVARNSKDTLQLTTDEWLTATAQKDENGRPTVHFNHIGPVEGEKSIKENVTPKFGDTFIITDYHFDSHGHEFGITEHTVQIPTGDLVDTASTGSDVITQLTFDKPNGKITSTRTNLSAIKLADYVAPISGQISAGDTLAQALVKLESKDISLQSAIDILNGNSSIVGSVAYQIAQIVNKNDNGSIDTLIEIAEWIADHPNEVAKLNASIAANTRAIEDLNALVGNESVAIQIVNALTNALYIEGVEKYALATNVSEALLNIDNEIALLKQEDINLHSRCNVLDKEVKNLINAVPAEKIAKWDAAVAQTDYDEKVAELEQADQTLNNNYNSLDTEVKNLINTINALQERVSALESQLNPPSGE